MAEALGTAPVILVVAASDDPAAPLPLPVTVAIPNDHLGYAITWFAPRGGLDADDSPAGFGVSSAGSTEGRVSPMHYVSTRGTAPKLGFEEAMLAGLARDGGLYVPETWPR